MNTSYGYENVPGSGAITVASGAIFDVSGGPGGANIDSTGGSVVIRAPILTNNSITNNSINVSFNGTVITNPRANGSASGDPLVVNAFAVWSTTDAYTDINKHFDGIIDPAGFFDATGAQTHHRHQWPLFDLDGGFAGDRRLSATREFLPDDAAELRQQSVQYQRDGGNALRARSCNSAAIRRLRCRHPALHLRPEIDLVNPSTSTIDNAGNITVASNWNFGAGSVDANGNINLLYRTSNGGEPGTLALRAANNVKINATISDGFFASYAAVVNGRADRNMPGDQLDPLSKLYRPARERRVAIQFERHQCLSGLGRKELGLARPHGAARDLAASAVLLQCFAKRLQHRCSSSCRRR